MLSELQQWEDRGEIELYYFDEAGFSQRSAIPYAWTPIGKALELLAYSHSKRLNVLGFLSRKGKLIYHDTTGKVTTAVVLEAFDSLLKAKAPEEFVIVVMDNASMHRSAEFMRQRAAWRDQRLYVLFLPAYSPELNLIEILWRKIKYTWLPVTAYRTFDELCNYVRQILSSYGDKYRIIFS